MTLRKRPPLFGVIVRKCNLPQRESEPPFQPLAEMCKLHQENRNLFTCRKLVYSFSSYHLCQREGDALHPPLFGTRNGNRTHNCPLGGGCYIHLTMQAYSILSCPHKEEAEKYAVLPCSPAWAYGGPSGARTQDQPVMSR